jgi:hypothetical protein
MSVILFTVVEEPRVSSVGTQCHGLYRSRKAADAALYLIVEAELEDKGLDESEIDEYLIGDSIDTDDTTWAVGRVFLEPGEVQAGTII